MITALFYIFSVVALIVVISVVVLGGAVLIKDLWEALSK